MNNTFSLERAKNGEPFTYNGMEARFGGESPDGKSFSVWVDSFGVWNVLEFSTKTNTSLLSMTPKKLEVKIWENAGDIVTTTPEEYPVMHYEGSKGYTLLKTIEVEI